MPLHLPRFILLVVFLSGCASTSPETPPETAVATAIDVPYERQASANACGAAVLSGVLRYWGLEVTQEALLAGTPPASEQGFSLGELKQLALDHGMQAFVLGQDLPFVEKQIRSSRPVIVPIRADAAYVLDKGGVTPLHRLAVDLLAPEYWHYVTVVGCGNGRVLLVDPVLGTREVSEEHFRKLWQPSGNAMLLISR